MGGSPCERAAARLRDEKWCSIDRPKARGEMRSGDGWDRAFIAQTVALTADARR